jgi:hypothetical protein
MAALGAPDRIFAFALVVARAAAFSEAHFLSLGATGIRLSAGRLFAGAPLPQQWRFRRGGRLGRARRLGAVQATTAASASFVRGRSATASVCDNDGPGRLGPGTSSTTGYSIVWHIEIFSCFRRCYRSWPAGADARTRIEPVSA